MRIDSIEIKNFRQYRNVRFSFEKQKEQDIHIILGRNTVGKTNVLNAITWCLYNKEYHLADKSQAKEKINDQYVAEIRRQGGNEGTVSADIQFYSDEDGTKLKIKRTSKYRINLDSLAEIDVRFSISIYQNGDWRICESPEETSSLINKYLPESINKYIFFDGEQLEQYFRGDKNIENGINELTQASLLKQSYDHLVSFKKNSVESLLKESKDTADLQRKFESCETKVINQENVITEINNQIIIAKKEIAELEEKLKGKELVREKVETLKTLESEIKQREADRKLKVTELCKFTADYYTLFSLYPTMKHYYDFIKREESDGNLPPKIDKDWINEMLEHNHCGVCGCELDESGKHFIQELQKKFEISSALSNEMSKTSSALIAYFDIMKRYKEKKDSLLKELNDLYDRIEKIDKESAIIKSYLKNFDSEDIPKLFKRKEELEKEKESKTIALGSEGALFESLKKERNNAKKELDDALRKNNSLEVIKRKRDFCDSCLLVLKETREEVLDECRKDLQDGTFSLFDSLTWKKDAYSKVEILEDYSFKLLDKYGVQTLGSCSAAERALLALSFTLSLQSVSKHDAMLFIDTPLGRVDDENRDHFIKTLLKISETKQVILTFTPTEYDSNVKALLNDKVSSLNELSPQNNSETTIKMVQ